MASTNHEQPYLGGDVWCLSLFTTYVCSVW